MYKLKERLGQGWLIATTAKTMMTQVNDVPPQNLKKVLEKDGTLDINNEVVLSIIALT